MRAAAVPAVLLALVVALAACGKDTEPRGDEAQVRATLARFGAAVARKDTRTLCDDLFAPELLAQLGRVGLPCETAMRRSFADVQRPVLTVRSVQVTGGRASAVVRTGAANQPPSDDTVRLVRQGEGWRIAALASPSRP